MCLCIASCVCLCIASCVCLCIASCVIAVHCKDASFHSLVMYDFAQPVMCLCIASCLYLCITSFVCVCMYVCVCMCVYVCVCVCVRVCLNCYLCESVLCKDVYPLQKWCVPLHIQLCVQVVFASTSLVVSHTHNYTVGSSCCHCFSLKQWQQEQPRTPQERKSSSSADFSDTLIE